MSAGKREGLEWVVWDTYVSFEELASAPSTPETNILRLYAKDSSGISTLCYKNDAGTEICFPTSGSFVTGTGTDNQVAIWNGTTAIDAFAATAGSVLFAGVGGILAQDNANLFFDDTNNRLGVGIATPANQLEVGSTGSSGRGIYAFQASADATSAVIAGKKSRGTLTAPTATNSADSITDFQAEGYDGAAFARGTIVRSVAGSLWSGTNHEAFLSFFTVPSASTSLAERFRFGSAGQLGIGGATFGTAGQVFTSGGAAAPPTWTTISATMAIGGTVTSGTTGSVLFVGAGPVLAQDNANFFWDDTNNHLLVGAATHPWSAVNGRGVSAVKSTGTGEFQAFGFQAASATAVNFRGVVARGSASVPTATKTGDLAAFIMGGHDGSNFGNGGRVAIVANQDWAVGAQGNYIEFDTIADGSTTATERLRIEASGDVSHAAAGRFRMLSQNRFRHLNSLVRTYPSGDQTGLSVNVFTSIAFNTDSFDTDALHDTVTNNTRITVALTGKYLIGGNAYLNISGVTAPTKVALRIMINGTSPLIGYQDFPITTGDPTDPGVATSSLISLVATDYVELQSFVGGTSGTYAVNGAVAANFVSFWAVYLGE